MPVSLRSLEEERHSRLIPQEGKDKKIRIIATLKEEVRFIKVFLLIIWI